MADVVHNVQQEFWKSPTLLEPVAESPLAPAAPEISAACAGCGTEFLIGARFCHACGQPRARQSEGAVPVEADIWSRISAILSTSAAALTAAWRKIDFPDWLQYLHFHEIQRWVGLPTASFAAFLIGLGCIAGAIGVSLFYRASNLAEFEAIQMWRIEWLLAATASFVAGILLKKPSRD